MTSDRDFSGPLTRYTAGQCFGCAYVAPTQVPEWHVSPWVQ